MTDDVTQIGEHGFAPRGEDRPEEADVTVRVAGPIRDIPPAEVTTIALRVKGHLASGTDGLWNQRGEHVSVEDDGIFVFSRVVRRIRNELRPLSGSLSRVRIATSPHATDEVITRSHGVDEVIEATVAALHAERLEKFAGFGIAEVLTDIRVELDDVIAGLRRSDQEEHRSAVLTAIGVGSRTVADELGVDITQDSLSQSARRQVGRAERSRTGQKLSLIGVDLVVGQPDVFVAVAVFPSILRVLS